jgi:diguanylate cyclase (GGDEF)-like protein/PAS domain S-box-containing protein
MYINLQSDFYLLTLYITVVIALIVAWAMWNRRYLPGSIYLSLLMLAVAEWTTCGIFETIAIGQTAKILWSKVEYLGSNSAAPLLLMFVLHYTNRARWLTRRNLALIWIAPVLSVALVMTNDWHGLIWPGFSPGPAGSNLLIYQHGPGFWFYLASIVILILFATVLLFQAALSASELYRRQAQTFLIASIAPWVGVTLYVSGITPFPGYDTSPVGFMFTGAILAWGIYRSQLLDLVPVARDTLIENMSDSVIVLGAHNRILDINPAAQRLLGQDPAACIGRPIETILPFWQDFQLQCQNQDAFQAEIPIQNGKSYLDLRASHLYDRGKEIIGCLIILRDISQQKRFEADLQQVNQRLQEQLSEINTLHAELREQAIRDPLTGLLNRRVMEEVLDKTIAQSARLQMPLSVVMIDVDHFKIINDTYGHQDGDEVLRWLGRLLKTSCRKGDIACRYGGEEFLIIMVGASVEDVARRAEEWRRLVEAFVVSYDSHELSVTISLGVANLSDDCTDTASLLKAADHALYQAKLAGRNCVRTV